MKRAILFLVIVATLSGVATAQTTSYFPRVANGVFGDIFFTTTIFVANPAESGTIDVTFTFTQGNGSPLNVSFVDEDGQPVGAGNMVPIAALAAGQSRKLVSTGEGSLLDGLGFATISSSGSVSTSAVYSQFSGVPGSGTLFSEAAVTPAEPVLSQAIFMDETGNFRTSLAYANPSQVATATVSLNLLNTQALQVLTTTISVDPLNGAGRFVDEFFAPSSIDGHVGTLQIVSDTGLVTVALRFAGNLFTSIPPFPLAALSLPIHAWSQPVDTWLASRPWLSPLASFARLIGSLQPSG